MSYVRPLILKTGERLVLEPTPIGDARPGFIGGLGFGFGFGPGGRIGSMSPRVCNSAEVTMKAYLNPESAAARMSRGNMPPEQIRGIAESIDAAAKAIGNL